MSGILRLESLTKGNTLKQGDKTPLKYRLFDADGEKLNIAGKSAQVRLVYPDFLTIGYEKGGLTVAQDDTVTFTIDGVIPSRIYHVEIIVDDKFIFPSRADEAKFTVDKSSLGTEANVIEIVGVDQIVNTVLGRVDADINQAVTDITATNEAIQQAEQERVQGYREIQQLIEDEKLDAIPADGSTTPEKLSPDLFELLEIIKMENLIKNASLENFDGWESRSVENAVVNDGAISFTANGAGGNFFTTITASRKVGDKYYISAQVKTTGSNARIVMFGNSQDSTNILANGSGEWERQSFIHEVTQSDSFPLLFRISDYGSSNWQEISMTRPLVVNLTEVFGKGNEPSKIAFEVLADNLGLTDFFFTGTFTRTKILPSAISDGSLNQPEVSENYCVVNSDKIEFAFRDRSRDLKIGMGKRGPNQIFDFTTVEEKINSSPSIDLDFSNYTPVLLTVTDWFGPYVVRANNNIDGDNIDSGFFTGGNHGYDNTGTTVGNSATGRTVSVEFYVDGRKEEKYSGSFNRLKIIWTNRIQGNNTTRADGSGREILEETFRAEISNGKMDIFSEIKALEDITIETYYGLQTVFRENEQTYQFIGGTNRGIYQTEVENSGDKSCVGVILKGNLNLKMMIDPTVGIGDNKLASYPTYSFRRGGQKMYGNLIRGDFNLPENNVLYYAGQYDFTI